MLIYFFLGMEIEDITQVVIAYEVYQMSPNNELNILFIIRPFIIAFYCLKRVKEKRIVVTDVVMTLLVAAKVLLHMRLYHYV